MPLYPQIDLSYLLLGLSDREFVALLAVAFIAGLARGFSGFGAALIFVPVASAVIGPKLAAPLLLVIDTIAALGLIPDAWRKSDRRGVGTMVGGALVGIPLGTAVLTLADPLAVRWAMVAGVTALFILLASGWCYRGRPSSSLTVLVGAISGVFTGAAQIGGPPVVAYWLGGTIQSAVVRANILLYFAISSVLTGASYLATGLLTQSVIVLSLTTGPLYGLGLYFGSRLFGRANDAVFRWACLGLIAVAGLFSLPVLDSVIR